MVSGIGIMNIMLVTVTERTREIGIRKAIGARHREILYQFLIEAMLISGIGSVLGILIALAIPVLVRPLLPGNLRVPVPWLSVVLAFVVACSTGLFFGYLPANKAAQLPADRVAALRISESGGRSMKADAAERKRFVPKREARLLVVARCSRAWRRALAQLVCAARAARHGASAPSRATHAQAGRDSGAAEQPRSVAGAICNTILRSARRTCAARNFCPISTQARAWPTPTAFRSWREAERRRCSVCPTSRRCSTGWRASEVKRGRADGGAAAAGRWRTCSDAVIVRAASSYLELAKVRRELDLMRRERESAQKILDFTQERGPAPATNCRSKSTKAQLTAARVEQRIAQLEDQEDTLAEQLRSMLGYPQDAAD